MTDTSPAPERHFNCALTGFVLGGVALIWVIFHFVSGPFAPQTDMSVTLGELASDAVKSAARDMIGLQQPAPETLPWDIDRVLRGAAIVAGGIAILLGVAGLTRHENNRMSVAAIVLGGGAIVAQAFIWALLLVLCALVVTAFLNMIGDWSPFG